jgi:hypothetical protein
MQCSSIELILYKLKNVYSIFHKFWYQHDIVNAHFSYAIGNSKYGILFK